MMQENNDYFDKSSGSETDFEYFSEHNTDSNESISDTDMELTGKDGLTKWNNYSVIQDDLLSMDYNINELPNLSNISIDESFRLLFTDDIIQIIIKSTNIKIESIIGNLIL
ncbi:hypothetical protein A3Q56_03377 [Intoshia linei]|uniref:Uncharacterized protein n=1 Tax=Intoshia linei TaxID=1819745 RepID=A0A177B638_9BILA|nr:hypothetical protein A3Q56_03377 [Intoshia linei]